MNKSNINLSVVYHSDQLTFIIPGNPDFIVSLKLIIFFKLIKSGIIIFDHNLILVATEIIIFDGTDTVITDKDASPFILCNCIFLYHIVVFMDQQDSISLVGCDFVGLDGLDSGCGHNPVIVMTNDIRFDKKLLSMDGKDALTPCRLDLIFINKIVDIIGTL